MGLTTKPKNFKPVASWRSLSLLAAEIHIWRFSLDQPDHERQILAAHLSPDERSRAKRFQFDRDRCHFIVGRGTLRTILGGYLDIEPSEIRLIVGAKGKPALMAGPKGSALHFNLSHSNGLALCVVAWNRRVGIDLEYIQPVPEAEKIARRFFSKQEYAMINTLPEEERVAAFFTTWVSKEACLKVSGDGLSRPLDHIRVSSTSGELLVSAPGDGQQDDVDLHLEVFCPAPGYAAALAAERVGREFVINYLSVQKKTS